MSAFEAALALDRMAIEEVGANPEKLAQAIHLQLGLTHGPVPVFAVARALDIVEIREAPLTSFEGALLTNAVRTDGSILINSNSSPERRRFTLSHELGHFLNPTHKSATGYDFQCSKQDMIETKTNQQHQRQETEANRFAIELLAPPALIGKFVAGAPDLRHVLSMANELEISKEAAARRYVEKQPEEVAVIFSQSGKVIYWSSGRDFPAIIFRKSDPLPIVLSDFEQGSLTDLEPVEPRDWIFRPGSAELWAQTLCQQKGFAMTLLVAGEADHEGEMDTFTRFRRD